MIRITQSTLLLDAGFSCHGFTERGGGVSSPPLNSLNFGYDIGDMPEAVKTNLSRLQSHLNVSIPLFRVRQTHGNTVIVADNTTATCARGWHDPPTREADGIVTDQWQMILAVQTADCAGILIADPETRAVAAVHAGWRGLYRGVVRNAIRTLSRLGAASGRLVAAIGPRICSACYEVGGEVARHFPESSIPSKGKENKYHLDLGLAAEVSLIGAGLTSRNIDALDSCTSCRSDDFFSYRVSGGTTGRGLGFVSGLE